MAKKRSTRVPDDLHKLLRPRHRKLAVPKPRPGSGWVSNSRRHLPEVDDLEREAAEAEAAALRAKASINPAFQELTSPSPLSLDQREPNFHGRAGEETQETSPDNFLKSEFSKASNEVLLTELKLRGVTSETLERIREEIADKRRPRWDDEDLPKELRGISAPAFLKLAWKDILGRNKVISKQRIRRYDEPLLKSVEAYISKRVSRDAGLGDADGITFILEENMGKNASRKYQRIKAGQHKPG